MINRGNEINPDIIVQDIAQTLGGFVEDRALRLADADSAHGVLFGELPDIGLVAVKPHDNFNRADTERRNLERVARLGFESIQPERVAIGGMAAYLVTLRRTGLRHLGQLDWNVAAANGDLQHVVIPALERAAATLATWHLAGVFHGDAQAKNMVYDVNGTSVFVDAEKTQFNPDDEHRPKLAAKDVRLLGLSVLARGLLRDQSPELRLQFVNTHLVEPYLRMLAGAGRQMDETRLKEDVNALWVKALENGQVPEWIKKQNEAANNA